MFEKILIANRGEIACRVIATAKRMGISTVAVYSEADRNALHVERADQAVYIGPPPAAQSYLDQAALLAACQSTGAQALHPGYGFLSENPDFAQGLCEAGIAFIGPKPHAIKAMGDKITAKRLAQEAGVNVIPGHPGVVSNANEAISVAGSMGYPVMLKASAGGGGKGMRIAYNDEECRSGFERATSEAMASFADARIFVEKFIEQPRHIEIQVLADTHGNIVHLGERECSVQRRHQKVIEEAPSVFLDDQTREAMGAQAVGLARAVDYCSAGTVEFIVDPDRRFYFLEMNTRLQVEHPVTELVTGIDLVEEMIRISNGEPLSVTQSDVVLDGWAMEARLYAEDPFRNFLPSIGRLTRFVSPPENERVRVDTGVNEGTEVSVHYDPLIAKLITGGADRVACIRELGNALDAFYVRGVSHNIRFLRTLLRTERFLAGDLDTNLIADVYPDGFRPEDTANDPQALVAVAGLIHARLVERELQTSGQLPGFVGEVSSSWLAIAESFEVEITLTATEGGLDVDVDGRVCAVRSEWRPGEPLLRGTLNGESICVQVDREGLAYRLTYAGSELSVQLLTPCAAELAHFMLQPELPDLSRFLLSPMPGLLVSVSAEPGREIKAGEELAVVEAMKMENTLRAVRDGKVAEVLALPGETLAVDQPILEFE